MGRYAERLAKLRGCIEAYQAQHRSFLLYQHAALGRSGVACPMCAPGVPADLAGAKAVEWARKGDRMTRIAYISGDLRQHAVSMLIPGLLESHDRDQFEITAVSLSAGDGSAERARIVKAVDCFLDADRLAGP